MSAAERAPIGRSWPAVTYEVGGEKVREYAEVVGEAWAAGRRPPGRSGAGAPPLVAPAMFCVVYLAPAIAPAIFDPELGIDHARFVHGAQRFEWGEPVRAGDLITTSCRLVDAYAREAGDFYELESVSVNQRGSETVRASYTGIVRAPRRGSSPAPAQEEGEPPAEDGPAGPESEPGRGVWQLPPGDPIPSLRVLPDRYLPYRYAGASGDFTPIHIDPELARAVGFPGVILHGLYTMAVLARAHTAPFGDDPATLRALGGQFRAPAFPEREIVVAGTVTARTERGLEVASTAEQDGRPLIRDGTATLAG